MTTFLKMHGLGNDFVILDQRSGVQTLSRERVVQISDRHFGVGCDQLIVLEPSVQADVFMRIYNPDGSESEACGNATRCVASLLMEESGQGRCSIETLAGVLPCDTDERGLVRVDMGAPILDWQKIPLSADRDTLHLGIGEGHVKDPVATGMGNPHCTFFVDSLGGISVETMGPVFENHALFPNRANIGFAELIGDNMIKLKVWERGAGITLACGSAACAACVAAVRRGLTGRSVEIHMDGGTLYLNWDEESGHVFMSGGVAKVFEGTLS